jgi:hypothetical protein
MSSGEIVELGLCVVLLVLLFAIHQLAVASAVHKSQIETLTKRVEALEQKAMHQSQQSSAATQPAEIYSGPLGEPPDLWRAQQRYPGRR